MEAFAVPIKPGKEETWKSWAAETNGARKAEFDEMNQRMGITTHAAWLQQNPDGSQLAVVVLDGPGASEFLGTLATSDHEFDRWFRTNVEDIHPMDFSAPSRSGLPAQPMVGEHPDRPARSPMMAATQPTDPGP